MLNEVVMWAQVDSKGSRVYLIISCMTLSLREHQRNVEQVLAQHFSSGESDDAFSVIDDRVVILFGIAMICKGSDPTFFPKEDEPELRADLNGTVEGLEPQEQVLISEFTQAMLAAIDSGEQHVFQEVDLIINDLQKYMSGLYR